MVCRRLSIVNTDSNTEPVQSNPFKIFTKWYRFNLDVLPKPVKRFQMKSNGCRDVQHTGLQSTQTRRTTGKQGAQTRGSSAHLPKHPYISGCTAYLTTKHFFQLYMFCAKRGSGTIHGLSCAKRGSAAIHSLRKTIHGLHLVAP